MSDPLDELRRAWSELEAPEPDAAQADPQTLAALGWMRGAWAELEAPALPESLQRPPAQPGPVQDRPAPARGLRARSQELLALAAALVTALVLGALQQRASRSTRSIETPLAGVTAQLEPVQVTPLGDGELELRRGRVRLVLINNPTNVGTR